MTPEPYWFFLNRLRAISSLEALLGRPTLLGNISKRGSVVNLRHLQSALEIFQLVIITFQARFFGNRKWVYRRPVQMQPFDKSELGELIHRAPLLLSACLKLVCQLYGMLFYV